MYRSIPMVKRALSDVNVGIPDDRVGIRGNLYDVEAFDHPGGSTFLTLVRGTDATALFETHHINSKLAERALSALPVTGTYVVQFEYDYTRYSRLRSLALALFPTRASRRMASSLRLWGAVALALVLHGMTLTATVGTTWWATVCLCAAYANSICGGYGHNALHRLEAWAILLDWNGLSCLEWLMEHVQSHHMYVNTRHDHDSISMEPFVRWLPGRPVTFFDRLAPVTHHAIYLIAEVAVAIQGNLVHRTRWKTVFDARFPVWLRLAPLVFVIRMFSYVIFQGAAGLFTALLTLCAAGYIFAYLAHLNHAFDGDGRPDFVEHQLKNTKDIGAGIKGEHLLFLDRQTLHHLFPTIDHTLLTPSVRTALSVDEFMTPRSLLALDRLANRSPPPPPKSTECQR